MILSINQVKRLVSVVLTPIGKINMWVTLPTYYCTEDLNQRIRNISDISTTSFMAFLYNPFSLFYRLPYFRIRGRECSQDSIKIKMKLYLLLLLNVEFACFFVSQFVFGFVFGTYRMLWNESWTWKALSCNFRVWYLDHHRTREPENCCLHKILAIF